MYGYSEGYIGQGASYGFMSTYLVVFLSECVGLSSAKASTISALALTVEVIVGMLVGNASDNCTSKMGRRRPFILAGAISMLPIFLLLFHTVSFEGPMRFVYYLFFAILFRVFFSCFEITNQALGAEIAFGYDERTKLRTISRVFSIIGSAFAYLTPLYTIELFKGDIKPAWQITGLVIGIVTSASWFLSFRLNKGKGIVLTEKKDKKSINVLEIVKNYRELLKLKPAKHMVIYKAGFTCAYALVNVATIYYMKYSVGLGENFISYIYYITLTIFVLMIPFVSKMAIKFGKTMQQAIVFGLCALSGIIVYFFCPSTFFGAALFFGMFSVAQTSFWQLSSAIFYDIIEVDEWENKKRREGDMSSMISVLGTLISAIMIQAFGLLFDACGYDQTLAIQPEGVTDFLNLIFILVPSICLIACVVALKMCPINKKTFESLQNALDLRKKNEDYSAYMDDVNKILGK